MGFTRAELESFRGATVPDLIGPRTRLLIVGINPGLWTAAVQAHFGRRGNRFYPALHRAGITARVIDASGGYRGGCAGEDVRELVDRGVGITNLVARATARADELDPAELVDGARNLAGLVGRLRPQVVAVLGVTAYRTAFALPKARTGRQPGDLGGSQLWVVPNPSGLNAHASLADLAVAYREAAIAAGIAVYPAS